jgi:hypothetical protein
MLMQDGVRGETSPTRSTALFLEGWKRRRTTAWSGRRFAPPLMLSVTPPAAA